MLTVSFVLADALNPLREGARAKRAAAPSGFVVCENIVDLAERHCDRTLRSRTFRA